MINMNEKYIDTGYFLLIGSNTKYVHLTSCVFNVPIK